MAGVIEWGQEHPVPAVIGIVVVAYLLLHLFGSGNSAASANNSGAAAYYQAQAAQAANNDAVQIAQINTQAATAQAGILANASTTNNTTWANLQGMQSQQYYANAANVENYNNAILTQATILSNAGNYTAANIVSQNYQPIPTHA